MLFSKSIVICQLPFEPSPSGAWTLLLSLIIAEKNSSKVVGAVTLLSLRTLTLYQRALPRWTFTGTDQTSPFALTMSLKSFGIVASQFSSFQICVIGSILPALTQVLMSSWPAWTWKLSGGWPPVMRVASTAFAFVPAPPATASFLIVTSGYFCL